MENRVKEIHDFIRILAEHFIFLRVIYYASPNTLSEHFTDFA